MLQVERLSAGYGLAPVLRGVSFTVEPGRIVSLLGRNGSGRTTTLKAVAGLVAAQGAVAWRGGALLGLPPFAIARRGVGYVAESRDVFPTLSVEQNLLLGEKPGRPRRAGPWNTAEVYRLFPRLHDCRKRPAGVLSGGEQQMLAIGRCLMGNPELLLIDEPDRGPGAATRRAGRGNPAAAARARRRGAAGRAEAGDRAADLGSLLRARRRAHRFRRHAR